MHMARRAVAWAAWTCNTGFVGYSQRERASARSFFWRVVGRMMPADFKRILAFPLKRPTTSDAMLIVNHFAVPARSGAWWLHRKLRQDQIQQNPLSANAADSARRLGGIGYVGQCRHAISMAGFHVIAELHICRVFAEIPGVSRTACFSGNVSELSRSTESVIEQRPQLKAQSAAQQAQRLGLFRSRWPRR